MVDGKVSPSWDEFLALSAAACRFVDDHTYRLYGVKGGQVYRVALDLGG